MTKKEKTNGYGGVIFILLVLYFVPFIAVFLDEVIFKTGWCNSTFGDLFKGTFKVAYWPLIKLVQLLLY